LFKNSKRKMLYLILALLIQTCASSTYVCTSSNPTIHYVTESFHQIVPTTRLSTNQACYSTCGACVSNEDDEYVGYRAWCHPSVDQINTYQLEKAEEGEWDDIIVDQSYGYYSGKPSHPFIFSTYLCYGKHSMKKVWHDDPYTNKKAMPQSNIMFQVPRG